VAAGKIQVLAFVGAPAAGKTEAASVARELGIPVVVMGDVIREELKRRGIELSDANAGRIATELRRRYGMDAIAKRCIPYIERASERAGSEVVVVDGIRGIAEVEAFKAHFGADFMLVNIHAPLLLRYSRIKRRGRGDDSLSLAEFRRREEREIGWGMGEAMKEASVVIKNEGSLADFKAQIRELLLRSLSKHNMNMGMNMNKLHDSAKS